VILEFTVFSLLNSGPLIQFRGWAAWKVNPLRSELFSGRKLFCIQWSEDSLRSAMPAGIPAALPAPSEPKGMSKAAVQT
jgi:hypothetical protein